MKTAIAFGVFDGLHIGHRAVLEATRGYKRIAVTFSHLPKFDNKDNGLLMTYKDRESALYRLGMDEVVCLDLEEFKDMPAKDFLDYIKSRFNVSLIACGENFRFGAGAAGDTPFLKSYCHENKITLSLVKPVASNGVTISSSYLRNLIRNGDIQLANNFLYTPFGFTAKVLRGDKRGRALGFPTINQIIPKELLLPKNGVYKATVSFDGKTFSAASNIGIRPTFKTDHIAAETYIINYSGELYDKYVTVYLEKYIRSEKQFSSTEELVSAIKKDITEVLK